MDANQNNNWPFKVSCNVCLKLQPTILLSQPVFDKCVEMSVICTVCKTKINATFWHEEVFPYKDSISKPVNIEESVYASA